MRSAVLNVLALLAAAMLPFVHAQVRASELATLDFNGLIGGPLMAVIDAQSAAALTTMDFIRNVGFDENGDARNVSFIYDRLNSTSGAIESKTLTVPLLTIIPIPYVRISDAYLEFNARIHSVTSRSTETVNTQSGSSSFSVGGWYQQSSSYSNQQTQKNSNKEEREFTLRIIVEAVQDDMPAGLARILSLLEEAMLVQHSPLNPST